MLEYHNCDQTPPAKTLLVTISNHKDEVWYLAMSPDGTKLASASRDRMINIWEIDTLNSTLKMKIITCIKEAHLNKTQEISTLQWSPNSQFLLTC